MFSKGPEVIFVSFHVNREEELPLVFGIVPTRYKTGLNRILHR